MNYLAHGFRFLESPLMLAGTAVPDWLSVVDRRVRVRSQRLRQHLRMLGDDDRVLVAGMLQHLQDDDAFHRSPVFMMLESELSLRFRRLMPDPFDHRPGFLGHIVTELLLDAFLVEEIPEVLSRYYHSLSSVSPVQIEQLVNRVATRRTDELASFIIRFRAARFLYDYVDDHRLLSRLNQVLRRVTLPLLDEDCLGVLREGRDLLRLYAGALLKTVEMADQDTTNSPTGLNHRETGFCALD